MSRKGNPTIVIPPTAVPVLLLPKKKIRRVKLSLLPCFSKGYNDQFIYLLQAYDPNTKKIVYVYPFRTFETLSKILSSIEREGLWPLVSPNPVYVPVEFWKEYRQIAYKEPESTVKLVRKYKLLKDSAIHVFKIITIDIDSPFEDVYPVWKELLSLLELQKGYRVFKTKSSRFRAYISLDGTKDFKRARELVAIIYAFFGRKELKADHTFVSRLNHPVFWEDYPLYRYELVENAEGANDFFELYRKVKELQKKLELWTFNGKNLTEEFWGKKSSTKRKKKKCKVIKAPAFVRRLQKNALDNFELWKRAVVSLAEKHDSYRYIHVIQPAIGWAKWLELPKEEVTEFLEEFLGEEKKKDVEKGWKYVRELEFRVNDTVEWRGKTREEWEKEVESYIKPKKEVTRQELLKEVFGGQVWLLELIVRGMEKEGKIESYFVKAGRGRPKKVYKLVAEVQQGVETVAAGAEDFSQNNNSCFTGVVGGRLVKPFIDARVMERFFGSGMIFVEFVFCWFEGLFLCGKVGDCGYVLEGFEESGFGFVVESGKVVKVERCSFGGGVSEFLYVGGESVGGRSTQKDKDRNNLLDFLRSSVEAPFVGARVFAFL